MEASARVPFKRDSGPGLSKDAPMFLRVERRGNENRTLKQSARYLYYRIYNKGGAMAAKMSFDTNDNFLGRVETLYVSPRHPVASLRSRIAVTEGVLRTKVQLFKNTDGDALLNDNDLSLLAQTYPGCVEDDPIAAVVYEDEPQVGENNTFSEELEATRAYARTVQAFF
ncbi:hypothetical protein K443DRAFT_430581 [Laccaria amethystina LaAM-08-1]|uniref:Uncharacterized protein n=1 Tax=Laccaria amethystina LaAM-08-1 TaxID=1095629 RepID=A0A0C9X877_9AGAR|nr:hypothetical protein K443DRAFT_430581 [Laccaria amethystina LaAM-08-1]